MYAIIDKRAPNKVKENLSIYVDDIFEFSSEKSTYNSISGHPDIFIFQDFKKLIIAPNSPKKLTDFFSKKKIHYSLGIEKVGESLEESTRYNCIIDKNYFFCKKGIPDVSVQYYGAKQKLIHLPQAYVRCSMFGLNNSKIVTSDLGIIKSLKNNNIDCFYFNSSKISIVDYKYGFIGGTMGIMDEKIFFMGNILKHKDGVDLDNYITKNHHEVVCLGDDFLYDGGGIFFVS